MYSAEISRKNPGCFIFLLDQSASMEDPFGGSNDRKKADDGAGGIVEQTVKFPLWFEAKHAGGTPMSSAFKMAAEIVQRWVAEHPKGFPPIVINITDGESTDGDPVPEAKALCSMGSDDGATLVFNIHLSSAAGNPIELPASDEGLPDKFAKQLFEMSSSLTPFMIGRAKELGMPAGDGARGFVFNAQPMQVIQCLDIGTRPANLR